MRLPAEHRQAVGLAQGAVRCYPVAMDKPPGIGPATVLPNGLELLRKVGLGGMGEVWRAHDPALLRDVAVKILHPPNLDDDPDATDLFVRSRREARACARVVHPNVAAVHGVGAIGDRPFIAMEWVEGPTLRAIVDRPDAAPIAESMAWIGAICDAVAHAHDRGVIHCDLKPENILLQREGDQLRPKLVDFRLARGVNLVHRRPTQDRGTRAYLAPEAGIKRPTAAVDQYALAMTFCELLTGERPRRVGGKWRFAGRRLPRDAMAALARGLGRTPERRFPTVVALHDALRRALAPRIDSEEQSREKADLSGFQRGQALTRGWLAGLPRTQLRAVVLGVVATAPEGFPEAPRHVVELPEASSILRELVAEGVIHGTLGGWALVDRRLSDFFLDALPGPVRRAVAVAVADVLAELGGRQAWMLEAAQRLYIGAGALHEAAVMAKVAAQHAVTATQRDQHLAAAVSWSASPSGRHAWLLALLERLSWNVACGWVAQAQPVLADALAVATELELAEHDDALVELTALDAQLRLLRGDGKRAMARIDQAQWQAATTSPATLAASVLVQSCVLEGKPPPQSAIDQLLRGKHDRTNATHAGAVPSVGAKLALAAWQRAQGHGAAAIDLLRAAMIDALDAADPLSAGQAAVQLADVLITLEDPTRAAAAIADAHELLAPLGGVLCKAQLHECRGKLAMSQGDSITAVQHFSAALAVVQGMGATDAERQMSTQLEQAIAACRRSSRG